MTALISAEHVSLIRGGRRVLDDASSERRVLDDASKGFALSLRQKKRRAAKAFGAAP